MNNEDGFCDFVVVIDEPFVIDPIAAFSVNQYFTPSSTTQTKIFDNPQEKCLLKVDSSTTMIIQTLQKSSIKVFSNLAQQTLSFETNAESIIFLVVPIFESLIINIDMMYSDPQCTKENNQKKFVKVIQNQISDEFMSLLSLSHIKLIFPILNTTMAITYSDFFVNVVDWTNLKKELINRGKRSLDLLEIEKREKRFALINDQSNDVAIEHSAMKWKHKLTNFLVHLNKTK